MISLKKQSVLVVAFILCIPHASFSQEAGHMESKVLLCAGAIRAAYVACEKFSTFIIKEKNYGDLGKFLSDINNYDVTIGADKGGYSVSFSPLPYEGSLPTGGGAVYHVDGVSYQVTSESHFK
jgi:hypothetical protein